MIYAFWFYLTSFFLNFSVLYSLCCILPTLAFNLLILSSTTSDSCKTWLFSVMNHFLIKFLVSYYKFNSITDLPWLVKCFFGSYMTVSTWCSRSFISTESIFRWTYTARESQTKSIVHIQTANPNSPVG